ncbi:MAG TPA: hypothetical protein VEW46_07805 [Pyrinomonadaceae bacterium]|nr:hypothetical protein [Pyrinomonadaceae bacterium]
MQAVRPLLPRPYLQQRGLDRAALYGVLRQRLRLRVAFALERDTVATRRVNDVEGVAVFELQTSVEDHARQS